ncbi:MAG: hypothetical protein R3A10_10120 [Caldilineaceae bacterium]
MPIRAIRGVCGQVAFFQLLRLDDVDRLLDAQVQACTADLANAQALRQETEDPVDRLALRFRETQLEAHITWLHECMTTLAADRHTVST